MDVLPVVCTKRHKRVRLQVRFEWIGDRVRLKPDVNAARLETVQFDGTAIQLVCPRCGHSPRHGRDDWFRAATALRQLGASAFDIKDC